MLVIYPPCGVFLRKVNQLGCIVKINRDERAGHKELRFHFIYIVFIDFHIPALLSCLFHATCYDEPMLAT